MSWSISLALAAEFSAQNCADIGLCAELKSNRIAEKSCYGDKKKRSLSRSPSGMILKHSESTIPSAEKVSKACAKWLTLLSQAASPVSRSQSPDSKRERRMTEIYGRIAFVPFAKYDRKSRSWKTSQACFQFEEEITDPIMAEFSGTWPRAGMIVGGIAYLRVPLVPRTAEIGSGSWPTPLATAEAPNEGSNKKSGPKSLLEAAKFGSPIWPTPESKNQEGYQVSGGKRWPRLGAAVRGGISIQPTYPTPTKSDSNFADPKHDHDRKILRGVVHDPNDSAAEANKKGQLNPDWVEWLMGWPIGWTDLKPLGTDKFRKWLELHGIC